MAKKSLFKIVTYSSSGTIKEATDFLSSDQKNDEFTRLMRQQYRGYRFVPLNVALKESVDCRVYKKVFINEYKDKISQPISENVYVLVPTL